MRRRGLLNHVIEGKIEGRIEVTGRRGRRITWLLYDLNETRGHWKLNEETLENLLWKRLWICCKTGYRIN